MSVLKVDTINEKTSGNGVYIPGHVVQVVSDTRTDSGSTTSTSFVDIADLSVSITPKSTSSKVLVTFCVNMGTDDANFGYLRLMRDSTAIVVGDASGTRVQVTSQYYSTTNEGNTGSRAFTFLDSPSTTSAVTYKVQVRCATSGTVTINRSFRDDNGSGYDARTPSTITAMEIAQ